MKRYAPLSLLTLLLLLVLGAVPATSQAASSASAVLANKPTIPHLALRDAAPEEEGEEFEEAEEEEEFEIEDCEAAEGTFEFEDDESEEAEQGFEIEECEEEVQAKDGAVAAPQACLVRTAESSITTLPNSDRVLLTVRYQTYAPSTVTLGLKLKDHKGSLKLEQSTKHLGKQGVLHISTKLTDPVMERAAKAQEFNVALRAPNTPGFCGGLLEQQLRSKHPVGNARVYTQPLDG